MYCADCGARNEVGSTFCRQCGVRLPLSEARPATERLASDAEPSPLERAAALRDHGDIDGAIELCRRVVVREPRNRSAHSLLGALYESKGQLEWAIREYRVVLEIDPRSTAERQRLARLLGSAEEEPEPSDEPTAPRGRYPPVLVAGAVAALICLVAIGAAIVRPRRAARRSDRPVPLVSRNPATGAVAPGPANISGAWQPPFAPRPRGSSPFASGTLRTTPPPPERRPAAARPARAARSTKAPAESIKVRENLPPPAPPPPPVTQSPPAPKRQPTATPEKPSERADDMVVPVGEAAGAGRETATAGFDNAGVVPVEENARPGRAEIWISEPARAKKAGAPGTATGAPEATRATTSAADVGASVSGLMAQAQHQQARALELSTKGDHRAALEAYRSAADIYGKLLSEGKDSRRIRLGKEMCEKGIEACRAVLGE